MTLKPETLARREQLFDWLLDHPESTREEMAAGLGTTIGNADVSVRHLRRFLSTFGYNLVCDPPSGDDHRSAWKYRIVETLDEAAFWLNNREMDADSRIITMHAVARSVANHEGMATLDGQLATARATFLGRYLEDRERIIEQFKVRGKA